MDKSLKIVASILCAALTAFIYAYLLEFIHIFDIIFDFQEKHAFSLFPLCRYHTGALPAFNPNFPYSQTSPAALCNTPSLLSPFLFDLIVFGLPGLFIFFLYYKLLSLIIKK